jgi:threonine dehydratase
MHADEVAPANRAPKLDDIRAAAKRLEGVVVQTPTLHSERLSSAVGADVHLKLESLQLTGSFKIRGAYNKCAQLSAEARARGVICASAGNHGQGVAISAQRLGLRATVFMPKNAPYTKVRAIRGYGAEAVLFGQGYEDAYDRARRVCDEQGRVFVHPYDEPDVIAGQGTIGLEVVDALPDVGTLVVPIGGGGLISGVATAVKALRPGVRIVGVVAAEAANTLHSFQRGERVLLKEPGHTIADGIRVRQPGALTFSIIRRLVDEVVAVTEDEIGNAIFELLDAQNIAAEGAGAAGVAALLAGRGSYEGPVCALVCGGNIDPNLLVHVIERGLTMTGAYLSFQTTVPDRPGTLTKLLGLLAEHELNILQIDHHRAGVRHPLGHVVVEVTAEAREPGLGERLVASLGEAGYAARLAN